MVFFAVSDAMSTKISLNASAVPLPILLNVSLNCKED